jgi:WD40 repeat protein
LSLSLNGIIKLWDIESNECIRTFDLDTENLSCAKIAPGNMLIRGYFNGSVKIGNTLINAHIKRVVDILILSQNKFITCSSDKSLKLFDFDTFECIRTFIGHESDVLAIDKISTDKIVSNCYKSIRIWNLNNCECLKVISDMNNIDLKVISKTELACSSNCDIKIWNINSGICLKTFEGHSGNIMSIVYLSKEQIASNDQFGEIRIWNLNNGECLRTFNEYSRRFYLKKLTRNLIISFTANKDTIKIWNTDTGLCLKVLQIGRIYSLDLF